ncbi:CAAX amino terminal protease family protein [Streptococcus dysgalactiae subsp. equisimilis SK1249]|nr:CAAX amino terminal protease family protein [Streptococcus dysgalactiae subsp. equisimilis SK1249]
MFKHLLKQDLSWQGGKDSPIKWYFGLGLLIFYHIGTIIVDQLAVALIPIVYQNVEPGTVPYQEFLNTTPLPLIIGQVLWAIIVYGIFYACGMRFSWVLLAGLVANQVIQMVSEWLPIGETANQVLLNQSLFQTSWPKLILVYVILNPFLEELVMRGLVMRYILPKYPYVAIIVSAWLFAGMHYTTSWIHSFLYMASGLVYAYSYYKTNRLIVPISIHAVTNLISLLFSCE